MKSFLIVNPKGGSGKSTLATNLAGYFAHGGHQVMLGDTDRQQSAYHWLAIRPESLPTIHRWVMADDRPARPPKGTTHAVIDTPAGVQGKALERMLKQVQRVIVPVQPSLFDMLATRHFLEALLSEKAVRKGKVSGAFCATWFKGRSAYVLQSFNGLVGDVYTQAHELGHAIHAYLGSRAQRPSNYEIGSCIAECGSTFGELLLTEHLLSNSSSAEEKMGVLCKVLDEFGMAAFQVSARYFFEHSLYDAIRAGRFLDGETISGLWTAARDKIYGDAVEWLPEMKWEWTMKLHYYIPNYRFYNYPYVFAQLFVFAMYRLYLEQGEAFVPKIKALLSAGSSRSPGELAAELGFDIAKEDFWQKGIDQAEEFIRQLESLR